MDKQQRFEFQQSIEGYLEQNQVYELFEGLLKELVLQRPDQPLDFLIQRLQKPKRNSTPQAKRL
jgi:adenylate kinase